MGEVGQHSAGVGGRPRDLLRHLSADFQQEDCRSPKLEETEGVELSLGLSLGGRFGVDPMEKTRLVRSSSIAAFVRVPSLDDLGGAGLAHVNAPLGRTVSLPTETDEEWRKRKEIQCLRRMEAKRKRSEKQRNWSSRSAGKEEDRDESTVGIALKGKGVKGPVNGFSPGLAMAAGWGCGPARGTAVIDSSNAKSGILAGSVALMGLVPSSQGSVGSQGSNSSGVSDFESRSTQGLNSLEARSPASVQSLPEQVDKKLTVAGGDKPGKLLGEEVVNITKNSMPGLRKPKVEENGAVREMGKNVMEEMPCVSTRGCGPNGRRIEGFLYRYRKGEEVRIVCVCHGRFLSPAEFVKHAGGGDVQHPLRHIVVNPSPSLL